MIVSLSLATFFYEPNFLFTLCSLQYHVHIRHRRDNDEQMAVVVVKHQYQGYKSNAKRASTP